MAFEREGDIHLPPILEQLDFIAATHVLDSRFNISLTLAL
jgi:hypothetical protein